MLLICHWLWLWLLIAGIQSFNISPLGCFQLVAFINNVAVGYLYIKLFFIFGVISLRQTPRGNVTESEAMAVSITGPILMIIFVEGIANCNNCTTPSCR